MSKTPKQVKRKPLNLKDIITQMKDTSKLMLDLAYSSILLQEEYFGEEVLELENKMTELCTKAMEAAMLASRGMKEYRSLLAILQIIHAAEKISNATVDIAKIELRDLSLPKSIIRSAYMLDETITSIIVPSNSKAIGKTIEEIRKLTGMDVIVVRKGARWLINPDDKTVLEEGDRVVAKGPIEALADFEVFIAGKHEITPMQEVSETKLQRMIRRLLIEMMNMSQLSVDLAYSSAIFRNKEIASEVLKIEEKLDELLEELERSVLQAAKELDDVDVLRGLLRVGWATESIADASGEIAQVILSGADMHPIFESAMKESEEIIMRLEVEKGSKLDGVTVAESGLQSDMGIQIVAIKKIGDSKWIYYPKGDVKIDAGDILIVKGNRDIEGVLTSLVKVAHKVEGGMDSGAEV